MGAATCEITLAGQSVTLMPQRAAYWRAASTLLVADLHLGKGETLAAGGVPVPKGIVEADLSRLSSAVRLTGASRILVLGDLLHAGIGIVPAMVERVAAWRRELGVELALVPGNHDRRVERVADAWRLTLLERAHREGPFVFVHDPEEARRHVGAGYAWSGHIHPLIRLRGAGDAVSLPCFVIGERAGVLPAFSRFTSGVGVLPSGTERVWGIAENTLVEAPVPRRGRAALA